MIDIPAGHLYLGGTIDSGSRERTGDPVLLDSSDLTTHGVIVGMTGSGKTGLGVVLLEEALLAGVPTLIVDPKGDLGNLLLTFPELRPDDFAPWVEDGDPAEVAAQWKDGLAGWDIAPARIAALRDAAEFTIYTPGSTAGVPLNMVGSLRRPAEGTDEETVADEVEGYVSGLLGMVGVESDPLSGREHILLANLIHHAWAGGADLDLAALVAQVQEPPLRKLGVYETDTFFPPADRTKLAMTLNGLLASRTFAAWAEGPDLDLDALLRAPDGSRPGCGIVSLAHLDDGERQFVVSLLLGKLVTWMRRQPGTDKLRVLVYFDEVMGFVPPTAAPPAKKPILTLFKQARAFGVGMVLATQNPVDVDYKGLSNAGTWMIGRLQTEQDKARLLDGLSSAGGGVDVGAAGDLIGSLDKRQFMLREPGAPAPSLFTTRWAMAYLRGPLTRDQIASLMADRKATAPPAGQAPIAEEPASPSADTADATGAAAKSAAATPGPTGAPPPADATAASAARAPAAPEAPPGSDAGTDAVPVAPPVADGVPVRWLDPAAPWAAQAGIGAAGNQLAPALVARVALLFDDDKLDLRHTEEYEAVLYPLGATVDPAAAVAVDHDDRDLRTEPPAGATYRVTDVPLGSKTWFRDADKALVDHLYRSRTTQVLRNPTLKLAARAGESAEEFAARCQAAADEGADQAQVRLQQRYEARIAKARTALDTAADRVEQAQAAQQTRRSSEIVEGAGSLLGAVLGGRRSARTMARDVGRVLTGRSRSGEASQRVETARNRVADHQRALADLEADLARELTAIDDEWRAKAAEVENVDVPLEKSDIRVTALSLVWVPGG
jgi:Helicase HerA, central domain